MERPKTSVNMEWYPLAWFPEKTDEKTRPELVKIIVQRPLDPDGRVPFTVFYWADERLYRVDGVAPEGANVMEAMGHALEAHWWRTDPLKGLEGP